MSLRIARRLDGLDRTLIRRIFDSAPGGAVNLGLGEPEIPTPEAIALAGVGGIASGRTGYTSTAGMEELRAAVARRYGRAVEGPEGILVTSGSQEALFACCMALLDPGDEVLYPDPGYPSYPIVARLIGARAVAYKPSRERGFRPGFADLEPHLTDRTRLVILNLPSNPTGACLPRDEMRRLLERIRERGVAWLSDEIYAGLRYDSEPLSALDLDVEGGLVISGLSKEFSMTGWRIGWIAGDPSVLARLLPVHQQLVTCASSLSQHAALRAFTREGDRARERILETFRNRRDLMRDELSRIPGLVCEPPDGAFYFFVDVAEYGDDLELCRRILERRRVITIPGRAFGAAGKGFVRLSFAATEESIRSGVEGIRRELAGSTKR
jgi:aspartate/methionine/tyrosine aminotransferase